MKISFTDKNQPLQRLMGAGAVCLAAILIAGCGSQYRPVVIPVNPTGPPSQPQSFAVVVSSTGASAPGIATIIDYSGDTVMAQSPIGPGPLALAEDSQGSFAYSLNSDLTLTNFQVSPDLQAKNLGYSTLPSTPPLLPPAFAGVFSPNTGLYVTDAVNNVIDVLSGAAPQTFHLAVPVAPTPILTIGPMSIGQRVYSVSQNTTGSSTVPYGVACNAPSTVTQRGEADAIEISTYFVTARIPLGICPVYAVQSRDNRRVYILNRGDDTISVINSQRNTLDQCPVALQAGACPPPYNTNPSGQPITFHPVLPLSLTAVNALNAAVPGSGNPPNGTAGMPATAGPVYAELNPVTNQLVVANYDAGTISIIDVGLDEYGNDSPTFGTTFTVPVGNNPASVTVLQDGSRAYVANQSDGTVSIINLISHTVEKSALTVNGHPWSVVSTQNSLYGKVYVASPDTPLLTIIRTDLDIVDATVVIEGNPVDVRVSTQTGSAGNSNIISRMPGAGQPCYLPPALMTPTTIADCRKF